MKTKIEIKTIWGVVLFEFEKENNTIKDTVEEAVKQKVSLYGANLRGANLCGANLRGANLRGANLCGANLCEAKNIPYISMNCPSDGAFIGWKNISKKLIKLLIPEDAKRSSATSMKCRCDKAQVLAITSLDEKTSYDSVTNVAYTPNIEYKVGEMVYPDKFDEDRWNECSNGIHFFINKQDAINY